MHPTHVVADEVDGYIYHRSGIGALFTGQTAQDFASRRNAELPGTYRRYRVYKLAAAESPTSFKLWQANGRGRYHATPSCSTTEQNEPLEVVVAYTDGTVGAMPRRRMIETSATEDELTALWESHIRANTDPSDDLCRCAWSKIPGHTLNKMDNRDRS